MRDCRRYAWKNLSKGHHIKVVDADTRERLSGMLTLKFGAKQVRLDTLAIDDPMGAVDFVEAVLARGERAAAPPR